jgi:DNA-binding transcriptional LysR family regulator
MGITNLDLSWDHFRSFLAVMRRGTLSAAARDVKATQPTLGRHIDALEENIGACLFERGPNGLLPTQTALAMVEYAETMERAALALEQAVKGMKEEVVGAVRITASDYFGCHIVTPAVGRIAERFPRMTINMQVGSSFDEPVVAYSDIAICIRKPEYANTRAVCVGKVTYGVFAHESYLARRGAPKTLRDFANHTLIGYQEKQFDLALMAALGAPLERRHYALCSDNELVQCGLLAAGAGIGGCSLDYARQQPGLVRLFPQIMNFDVDLWLVMHDGIHASGPTSLVFNALQVELEASLGAR